MNVVGYCRFSSEGQRDGYSIEAQQRAIREFCERENYNLIKFYIDEARSGTNDNRESFQQMIFDASSKQFKAVIVHKFDRFARNKYDSVFYKKKLRDLNIKLISILEPLDDSPESVILESLYEGMSDYYSKNLGREVLKGKKEAALKCQHNGGIPPFGFTVDKNMHYIIVPEEAEIIRKVFSMAELGYSHAAIARSINNLGYKNRNGNRFGPEYITRILTNELYKGTFVYGKKSRRESAEIIKVDNAIEAIVSSIQWDKVNQLYANSNAIAKEKRARSRNSGIDYLLTGYAYCGHCEAPLTGFCSHKNYKTVNGVEKTYSAFFYRCARKAKRDSVLTGIKPGCKFHNIRKDELEAFIFKAIESIIFNDANLKIITEKIKERIVEKLNKKNDINKYKNEIDKVNKQMDKLLDLYLDSAIEKDDYIKRKNELMNQLNFYEEQIKTLPKIDLNLLNFDFIKSSISNFCNSWKADTDEYKKMTLSTFVDSIIIDNSKIVIYFKFPINISDSDKKSEFYYENHFLRKKTTVSTCEV